MPRTGSRAAGPDFEEAVLSVIRGLGPGEISTYGEVAREAGYPGAARAVGHLLSAGADVPWWRVVAANGRLVPGNEAEHTRRLRAEGVEVQVGRVRWPREG
jgi:methylated-DNA-protein-cysteine methyltransferase related protein